MLLDTIHAKDAIASALCLEVREQIFSAPDEAAQEFGISPLGDKWRHIDRNTAFRVLLALLLNDMAFSYARVPEDQARQSIEEFLSKFSEEATFFTNGNWEEGWTKTKSSSTSFGPQWEPATQATFDGGVLVLDQSRSGILWLEDED